MAIAQGLPSPKLTDSTSPVNPSRAGAYSEAVTLPMGGGGNYNYADEGSFFTAVNATVGTGIAGHAAPVVADADTKALLHIFNGNTAVSAGGNGRCIIPVYLKLEFTAIGAGGTISYNVVYVDNKGTTALTGGGTTITPANAKSSGSQTSGATITFGAAATTMSSSKKLWAAQCREVIPVVNDTMLILFGAPNGNFTSALTTASTGINHSVFVAPPVSVAPGGNFNFARIRASQSGADSYTFSFGYIER